MAPSLWPQRWKAPALFADTLFGMYRTARRGDIAVVDPTLETLLGPRPQTMRDVLATILKPVDDRAELTQRSPSLSRGSTNPV